MKKILLGVCGSIAAYKAAELASNLCQKNYSLRAVFSKNANKFISALTFSYICKNTCIENLFDAEKNNEIDHIKIAQSADLLLIAPASGNTISKISNGFADDALTTIALAYEGKKALAPAMNDIMWLNPATKKNISILKEFGWEIIQPEKGMLSCGYEAIGRLASIEKITKISQNLLK